MSNGETHEVGYYQPDGSVRFASAVGPLESLGPGGFDPQNAPQLIGMKSGGAVEATYGEIQAGEFEDEFRGSEALTTYHKMLTDGEVNNALNYYMGALHNSKLRMQPASEDPADIEMAAFVADNLGLDDQSAGKYPMSKLFTVYRLACVYRDCAGELVFQPGPDGRFVLDKVQVIHPMTVYRINYDPRGGPKTIEQRGKVVGPLGVQVNKIIPVWKTVRWVHNDDGTGQGESLFRPAVLHWRIKRLMQVLVNQGYERFLLGVPMVKVPPTVRPGSKEWQAARNLCQLYVTVPRTGVVLPDKWEFSVVQMSGQMPDPLPYLEYQDKLLGRALGIEHVGNGVGDASLPPNSAQFGVTEQSVSALLKEFISGINLYVIPKIIVINWPDATHYPRLVADEDTDTDWAAAANLTGMLLNAAKDLAVAEQAAAQAVAAAAVQAEQAKAQLEALKNQPAPILASAAPKPGGASGGPNSTFGRSPAKPATAGGAAGSITGGAKGGSTSGSSSGPPVRKFGELGDSLDFAFPPPSTPPPSTPAPGADPAASDIGQRTAEIFQGLLDVQPSKIKRLLGYTEDMQAEQLNQYRMGAQTVRTVKGNKRPLGTVSAPKPAGGSPPLKPAAAPPAKPARAVPGKPAPPTRGG